jgi:hypothetical protein
MFIPKDSIFLKPERHEHKLEERDKREIKEHGLASDASREAK